MNRIAAPIKAIKRPLNDPFRIGFLFEKKGDLEKAKSFYTIASRGGDKQAIEHLVLVEKKMKQTNSTKIVKSEKVVKK